MIRQAWGCTANSDRASSRLQGITRVFPLAIVLLVGGAFHVAADEDASAPVPDKVRSELASKRKELAERMQKLRVLGPSTQSTEGQPTPAAATAELELLQSLDLIYLSHLSVLEQAAERRRELELLPKAPRGAEDAKVEAGPACSWLTLDDCRDQQEAEEARLATCQRQIAVAQEALQAAVERHEQTERARRQANEALEVGTTVSAAVELELRRRLAALESTVTQATLDLRRAELDLSKIKQQVIDVRCRGLREKVRQFAANAVFREEDLQTRLKQLAGYEVELRTRLAQARQRLSTWDAQAAIAATQMTKPATEPVPAAAASPAALPTPSTVPAATPATPSAPSKTAAPLAAMPPPKPAAQEPQLAPSAETMRIARRLCQEEISQLERRIAEIAAGRSVPTFRFKLANDKATSEEIATWSVTTANLLTNLTDEEQLLAARMAELMQDLTTLYRQARLATGQDSQRRVDAQLCQESLNRLVEVIQAGQLHVRAFQRTGQRFLQELRERGHGPRADPWWERLRDGLTVTWSYELVAVSDRPITVGKVVKGLVGLLGGILLAALVSRLLGRRLLPRLGFNPGASEAVRSLAFYLLCVVFGVVSLELANVPLTAFTFLGGAAAIAVGFASQDIVSNFMSGVILLAEQPIRVGDVVDLGSLKGTVERIGTRSTRVRTDTNVEITVPNSKLLGDNVTNLTLSDNRIRSSIKVSVDSGGAVADVKACLLAAAQRHPRVVASPAPFVLFTDFGDKSLTFELHFSIAIHNMTDCRLIESELREAIDAAFREAGFFQDTPRQAPRSVAVRPLGISPAVDVAGTQRKAA